MLLCWEATTRACRRRAQALWKVPLVVEAVCLVRDRWQTGTRSFPAVALAWSGVLVLVGALGLRAAVVDAGAQRDLELQEPRVALEREDVTAWSN